MAAGAGAAPLPAATEGETFLSPRLGMAGRQVSDDSSWSFLARGEMSS